MAKISQKAKEATVYVVVDSKNVVLKARTSLAAAYQDAFEDIAAESILFYNGTKGELVYVKTKGVSGVNWTDTETDYLEVPQG